MKSAIVTGANGFIGSALVKELLSNNIFVYALVHKSDSNLVKSENIEIIKISMDSISDFKFAKDVKIDVFYHLAWQGSAGKQRGDFCTQHNNIYSTVKAVELAAQLKIKRFIGAGSLMEKESNQEIPKRGTKPTSSTLYGSAKLAAHYMSKAVATELGIEHIWTYLSSYGIGDSPYRFVNSTLKKMSNNNEYIDFTAAGQFYDFLYITDVVNALFLLGEKGIPYTAYNIGSGNPRPLKEFIIEMKRTLNSKSILRFGAFEYKGVYLPVEEFSTDDLVRDTGFKQKISFEEGIRLLQKSML